ncbi:MAG: DUF1573 domain-containing protein [Ignavibacteria bacterium]|nr:DUF1573 domain-containing protein [Ignavibacteria bacterium]
MNRFFIYALLVVAYSLVLNSAPKLRFDCGDTYDWGKVRNTEEPLKAKIRLYNDGDDTLIIYSVRPGCGCTAAPLDKNAIEPKGYATMDVSLYLPNASGPVTKSITITSNDPNKKEAYLFLKAEYVPPIRIFPDSKVMISNIMVGDTGTYKIVIRNTTDEKILIREPFFDPEKVVWANIKHNQELKPNEDFVIEIKVAPDNVGNFSGRVTFKTTYPTVPRINIPIFGVVSGFKK